MKTVDEVKEFYDQDTLKKYKIRNNIRHFYIINKLKELGIRKSERCLEIGCGNGGVTHLIAKQMKGQITGIDISEMTIKAAKDNLSGYKNVHLEAVDLFEFSTKDKFDFIVLLDVLEHIPFDQHDGIVEKMSELLSENGTIFIHIPEPKYNAWSEIHQQSAMQVIDLAVESGPFLSYCYKHGLYLQELKSYSVFHQEHDYQYIVLRKNSPSKSYTKKSTSSIIVRKLILRLRSMF